MFQFKNIIFLSICFCIPPITYARDTCKDGSIKSQDIINCLMIDYEKSDKELNQLYQEIIHKLAIAEQKN